jgi:hypothetical protein
LSSTCTDFGHSLLRLLRASRTSFVASVFVCSAWLDSGHPRCLSILWQAILRKTEICSLLCLWHWNTLRVSAVGWGRSGCSYRDGQVCFQMWRTCQNILLYQRW